MKAELLKVKKTVAISRSELSMDVCWIHIPEKIDVRTIRKQMGLSQFAFANRFGLSLYTLRNREQGKRQPDLAVQVYLKVIEMASDVVSKVLVG
jgi:putative transcriptional regulator